MLVGNKKDLHEDRAVSEEEGRKLAESWNAVFVEASAKENEVTSNKVSSPIPFNYFLSLFNIVLMIFIIIVLYLNPNLYALYYFIFIPTLYLGVSYEFFLN